MGTSRNYSGIIGRLKGFTNNRDLKFNELNLEFLKRFESHHLSKPGNSINGIASYMRTIKAIYNKGIKEGIVDESLYPFKYCTIKTKPTEKRAIKIESIKKILEMKTEIGSKHFHYRNYFVLSYLMLGMSFIDMAFLRRDNIIDGRVKFQRRKTGKRYDIVITSQIKPIIQHYMDYLNPSGFYYP
ncbi:site-specific integrase [Flagellimonas sp. 2504JD4-2]